MADNLVIVESPAKAKTIEKYLGKDFSVLASYGHVRDLLPKTGAVQPENDFAMQYVGVDKNKKYVSEIFKALKKAKTLYLAPDPDREGEAIAWHICQLANEKGALKNKTLHRVAFNQITKSSVLEAIDNPRSIDMNLVNAQQARRALDYLVGFTLSPVLWRKIQKGLSAGRVQSPALRLIVEREEAIEQFITKEYWSIHADCQYQKHTFSAKLIEYLGEKIEQFSVVDEKNANTIKEALIQAAAGQLLVDKVDKKIRKRHPSAPFTTSTLQQDAFSKLGFSTKKTMQVAQQLYEGIDTGEGAMGLITYMRTDSVHLAQEAIDEMRQLIIERYQSEYLPDKPLVFKSKTKNAQEAHEAIRPTSAMRLPDSIKSRLTLDQYKLYDLIWKRTVASQMIHATLHAVAVDLIDSQKNRFRINGSTVAHPGFMVLYKETQEEKHENSNDDEVRLPPLKKGDLVTLLDIICHQHFTEPLPRYSEASLVKALEEYGIGRPSTYASIISTLLNREYVLLEQKRFHPTDMGRLVNHFLVKYFSQYVDYNFTAKLEDSLDEISRGEKVWIPVLKDFWQPFKGRVDEVLSEVKRSDVTTEAMDENCPTCGKPLVSRFSRRGKFIGCSGYPECRYTRNINAGVGEEKTEPEIIEGRVCPTCQSPLHLKVSRYGKFIGCSNYPKCKYTESLDKPASTNVTCPQCFKGTLMIRKSRKGKVFYGCSAYPECNYVVWNEPVDRVCPKCKWPVLTLKTTKRYGKEWVCPQENCDHKEKAES